MPENQHHRLLLHVQALAKVVHPYNAEQWKGDLRGKWWPSLLHKYHIEFEPHDDEDLPYDWLMILWHALLEHERESFEKVGTKRADYVKESTDDYGKDPF